MIAHRARTALLVVALGAAACQPSSETVTAPAVSADDPAVPSPSGPGEMSPSPSPSPTQSPSPPAAAAEQPSHSPARERPAWLGTRVLPRRADGFGKVRPTPPILRNRRLVSPDHLPDPPDGRFHAEIVPAPERVAQRSTWSDGCPVALDDLRYVTVSFWGFDDTAHTGELLVHRRAARDIVGVFRTLFRKRFPIEEMRVVRAEELEFPPTGDGNNTTSFVCRPSRGSTSWSQHAYGLAIDVNPFHNPYVKGDLVLPELASAYADRERGRRAGMVLPDGPVVAAFSDIGWGWGGTWSSPKDWMHFSANGR